MADAAQVTLVRSTIGTKPKQRGTLRALGLRRIDHTVEHARPARDPRHARAGAAPRAAWKRSDMMKIHDLKPAAGLEDAPSDASGAASAARAARPPAAARRARARAARCRPGFEGGQTPLHRRTPKAKGFNNPFRVEYHVVNLDDARGVRRRHRGRPRRRCARTASSPSGAWSRSSAAASSRKPLTVRAHGFSQAAIRAIEAAGGTRRDASRRRGATGRPPARGNALTNR